MWTVIDFIHLRIPILFPNPPMKSLFSGSKGKRKQTTTSKRNIPKTVVHWLRRKGNRIKENNLGLKALMLTANSAGLSRSNQHCMRTLHLSTHILSLYVTNQWLEIYQLEQLSGFPRWVKNLGLIGTFSSTASIGPCLLVST